MGGERFSRVVASIAGAVVFVAFGIPTFAAPEPGHGGTSNSTRRGRYGDMCYNTTDCGFQDAVCDEMTKICMCNPDVPVTNHVDKCGKPVSVNETCSFTEQCEDVDFKTECLNNRCACKFDLVPKVSGDGSIICDEPKKLGYYGDICSNTPDCGFQGAVCDEITKICMCHEDVPVTNHVDKCGKPVRINETCVFNEQCEDMNFLTECRNNRCACKFDLVPKVSVDGSIICVNPTRPGLYGDQCSDTSDCQFQGAICHETMKFCKCHPDVPLTNNVDKCGKPASLNERCTFDEQCVGVGVDYETVCRNGRCTCKILLGITVNGTIVCIKDNIKLSELINLLFPKRGL